MGELLEAILVIGAAQHEREAHHAEIRSGVTAPCFSLAGVTQSAPKPPAAFVACRTGPTFGRRPRPCRTACGRAPAPRLREEAWALGGPIAEGGAEAMRRQIATPHAMQERQERRFRYPSAARAGKHVVVLASRSRLLDDFSGCRSKRNAVFPAGFIRPAGSSRPSLQGRFHPTKRRSLRPFSPLSGSLNASARPLRPLVSSSAP